ncbi:MAG: conjugal transfer protein [Ruminococcaceae bacterium]|nr:conjugal transfer protein [Oscillospiraceae bacterium]
MDEQKIQSLWIKCPLCGGKTRTKVYRDTTLINFPLFCPKCKTEIKINVVQLKMVISKEPDA